MEWLMLEQVLGYLLTASSEEGGMEIMWLHSMKAELGPRASQALPSPCPVNLVEHT